MKRWTASLLGRLGLGLGISILLAWSVLAGSLYWLMRHELGELQDDHLVEMAQLLIDTDTRALPGDARHPVLFSVRAADGRLLAGSALLQRPAAQQRLSTQWLDGRVWRVRWQPAGDREVLVAQPLTLRDGVAAEVTSHMALPVLCSLLALLVLVLVVVWRSLRPLRAFAAEVAQRDPDNLLPLQTDVPSEVHPLRAAINDLLARVGSSIERERRFTADASHELRTPLAAIQVQLEVARSSPRAEARERALQQAMLAGERATHLLGQLLALARLDAGQVHARCVVLDVPALLQQAAGMISPPARIDCAAALPERCGDPDLLLIALRNLLDNARRYGGATCNVLLQADADSIRVEDDGPGVEAVLLSRLGERFYRPDGQREPGSGLGLSIVARVAEVHGAHLDFYRSAGGGLGVALRFNPYDKEDARHGAFPPHA
ncbi:two-component system, OmpR family, sensor histidine kinase QseC [Andreprevotia lacus DSM 23236]|jgi:two-component system sensor histidine kinase QseC|uniref:histidine kinase n=1 Tax=Andreprevotia lacus DSM 23236 TaxID=1121001 RepID=A0A1W1XAM0_9NEIS|nr:ATP-binding protein [Andreprevotia lacus]SMC20976.1 two-component system, OmpR family, sensor histidine kinase QseC [Andreprevotia lacus DSM 23236]